MLPNTRIEVYIDLAGFVLATESEANTFANQITVEDGSGCQLNFNAFTGADGLTKEDFVGSPADQSKCKNGTGDYVARSDEWKAKYVGNKIDEVGFQIEKAESQDR